MNPYIISPPMTAGMLNESENFAANTTGWSNSTASFAAVDDQLSKQEDAHPVFDIAGVFPSFNC